jgi:predicted amidohydrolase
MTHLGLVQMHCEKGQVEHNLARTLDYLHAAARRGVRFLAFPEMSLTGYADPGKYPQACLHLDGPEVSRLVAATHGLPVTLLAGLIEANGAQKPFITQVVVHDGQLLGYYRKRTIVDEEAAWFSPGQRVPVYTVGDLTFGVSICADIEDEALFTRMAHQGARLIFEVAAPGLYGEQAGRNWQAGFQWWQEKCRQQLGRYARACDCWIAVATQAGRTVDEDFPGGGYLFAPDGSRLYATSDWSPGAVYLDLDFAERTVTLL